MHYTDRRPTKLSILPTTGGAAISVHPVPTGPKKNNYTKGAGFEEAQGGWVRYTGGIVLSRATLVKHLKRFNLPERAEDWAELAQNKEEWRARIQPDKYRSVEEEKEREREGKRKQQKEARIQGRKDRHEVKGKPKTNRAQATGVKASNTAKVNGTEATNAKGTPAAGSRAKAIAAQTRSAKEKAKARNAKGEPKAKSPKGH